MKLRGCARCALLFALLHSVLTLGHLLDQESSGDFYDDEDFHSGSGSGFPDNEADPPKDYVLHTTQEPLPLSTTQATGPAPSASPAAEPSSTPTPETELESGMEIDIVEAEMETTKEPDIEIDQQTRSVEKQQETEIEMEKEEEKENERERDPEKEIKNEPEEEHLEKVTSKPTQHSSAVVTTNSFEAETETFIPTKDISISTRADLENVYITTETITEKSITESITDITTTEGSPTTVPHTTTRPIPKPVTPSITIVRTQKPHTTPSQATPTESSTPPMPTSTVQVKTQETSINNEVAEVIPNGDSENREEEGRQENEVRRGKGVPDISLGPDLTGNTIDTGSSAAQLPQKNILERKEVLIAVIVGGVVGALFAAFLVMLLVYRMKKKDEGSYTLEEPKQATVTYQKPDKQEEFYA